MAGNNPLEDLLQQLKNARAAPGSSANGNGNVSLGSVGQGSGSGGSILGGIGIFALAAVALMIYNAYYTIPSDSVGIVQRFGEYTAEKDPGLHFKMPLGIDTVTILPVKRQLKQEFGFGTSGSTNQSQNRPDAGQQSQMVTGDLNAALVEWVVQYRIAEPRKYLFDNRNPAETLRDISESVMRVVVGDRSVDEVITIGRQEIETVALADMQFLVAKYEIGVSIDQVQLKNINPPRPVQASFNEVNQAQ
ncbi:MAG: membrane protease subunit HflK, partial [Flavobacteriaceae bacterium]